MGLGREVADAYISVHGDLSDFRRDLGKADDAGKAFGMDLADSINEGFNKRGFQDVTDKWESVLDAIYTGTPFDWDKALGKFDGSDIDDAHEKITEFMDDMNKAGKITGKQYEAVTQQIREAVKTQHQLFFEEQDAAKERSDAAEARRRENDQLLFDLARMQEAQDRYNKSFEAMFRANEMDDLNNDFARMVRSVNDMDWTKFASSFDDLDGMRDRVAQVNGEMHRLGRISQDNADRMRNDVAIWIAGEEERRRSVGHTTEEVVHAGDEGERSFRRLNLHGGKFLSILSLMGRATKGFREHLGGFAGINVFKDMIREGLDFIHNLDRIALRSANVTTKLATMASIGGSGLASLVTIAGDLGATLGGLAAVAPGFLVGGIIQALVLKSAFQDMDVVLKDLAPSFHKLQDSISAKFWKQAADPIRNMVKTLLPTLTKNLNNTATSLGGLTGALANALGKIHPQNITTMFDRMNKGIDIAKGAMKPLVSAFTILGLAASQYFERFGTWIVDLSNRFNNFIKEAAADGRLIGWINHMIEGFKDMGRAIDGLFGIFNALDSAATAAGFGGLKTFADNMQRMAAAMQSAGAQTALTQLLSGMLTLTTRVGEALGGLGKPLQSIMPVIEAALAAIGTAVATMIGYIGQVMENPLVQKGIIDFTTGIATAVDKLAPAVEPFANSLGNIMTLFSMILQNVALIVTAFTVQLGPILDQTSAQFQTLVTPLGEAVVNLITAITPVAQAINDNLVGPLVSGIRDQILPGFNAMVTALSPVAAQMVAALAPVLQAIMPLVPIFFDLATTIGTLLGQAIAVVAPFFVVLVNAIMPIVTAIQTLVNMIAPFLIPAIQQIVTALTPVITVIGQVVGVIVGVLAPVLGILIIGVINNVVGVIHGFSEVFMAVVGIITALITGFGAFFTKLFQGDIGGAMSALGTMFADIWNNIMKLIGGALEFLWNAVQLLFIGKLIGGIRSALMSMSGFFSSIWNGIVSFLRGAMGNISGTIMNGLNAVRGFFVGAWNGMLAILRGAWQGIQSAVSGGISGMMGFIRAIPGNISSALGNLWSLLTGAGEAIIGGLLRGLQAAWGSVTSFVGGIADWIAKNKGPIPYDRKLLVPAGEAIMYGLENSMKDKFGNVMDFVSGMADMMASSFDKNKMVIAGANAAKGLAEGLKAEKSTVLAALGSITPDTTLSAKVTGGKGLSGVGTPTPVAAPTKVVNIAEGAIKLVSPVTNPDIAARKLLDGLVNSSTL